MPKITHVEIRMYRLGTGDCFVLKFFAGREEEPSFKMMIDAGSWFAKDNIADSIQDLKNYVKDYVDVLVVTHEHKDHVHAFSACKDLFCDGQFTAGEIWFGWTENDRTKKVKEWKDQYGEKKKALGMAAKKLEEVLDSDDYKKQFAGAMHGAKAMEARKNYTDALVGLADLHLSAVDKVYKGGLDGMEVVKHDIRKGDVKHLMPGDVITDIPGADGVKIYVLGPPKLYEDIKKEAGGKGESYEHNDVLMKSEAFGAAILNEADDFMKSKVLPFDDHYVSAIPDDIKQMYAKEDWRKIDYDWLYSAGSFALRMNSLTNNLSLAMAIEFENGKVMLFPGDAEFGSWASWHQINWDERGRDGQTHLTKDLLNRTVFYKVAHHLSHNGTAQKLGLELMNSKELVAMATLDYDVISSGWKGTMPNRAIIKELLTRTKGRLMIMNEEGLFFDFNEEVPLAEKISEARGRMTAKEKKSFEENYKADDPLFIQYTLNIE